MKNVLKLIGVFGLILSLSNSSFAQEQQKDTTQYQELKDIEELNQFGYKYIGQHFLINCKFDEIDNDYLSSTPDANVGSSTEGGQVYFDKKITRELVGFLIKQDGENYSTKRFYHTYGFQKDILEILKNLKPEDEITIYGTVVKWTNGDDVGFKVSKVVAGEVDTDNSNSNLNSTEANTGTTAKQGFLGKLLDKALGIGILVAILLIVGYFRRNKK